MHGHKIFIVGDLDTWSRAVISYSQEKQHQIRENGSVWLVTVSASKH
jgi:hypothetical protein